jgi:hypothetical protein
MTRRKVSARERRRLRELRELSDLAARAALGPLAAGQARCAEIRERIAELERRRLRLSEAPPDPGVAAYMLDRAESLRRHQAAEYGRLAAAEAELAELRRAAGIAVGRAEALKRLCGRLGAGCRESR